VRSDTIVAVGTIVTVALTALALHSVLVTGGVAITGGGYALAAFAVYTFDPNVRRRRWLASHARRIEDGPPGVEDPLPPVKRSKQLLEELERHLEENEWLCVIRLHGGDVLEEPGIAMDALPEFRQYLRILGAIGRQLEKAPRLTAEKRAEVAAELRDIASFSLRDSTSPATIRQHVVSALRGYDLTDRLVPLADVGPQTLQGPAGQWLIALFKDLECTYGVFIQEPDGSVPPGQTPSRPEARRYASNVIGSWLSEQQFEDIIKALWAAVGGRQDLDLRLLKIRCAVLALAEELEQAEPAQRLLHPESSVPPVPEDRAIAAALEVRWIIDRKAALLARTPGLTGVFDRLAVIGKVTPEMFGELIRDLGLGTRGTRELYDWLRGDEFRLGGVIESDDDVISLVDRDSALKWLREAGQSAAYQDGQIAAERCYRLCRVLDRAEAGDSRYSYWAVSWYSGLDLFENPVWWDSVTVWCGHATLIDAPEHRKDAGDAITCLFLEAWWWWGDQLRATFVGEVIDMAKGILRDRPGWIDALDEFDKNYAPEFNLRAGAVDRWRHVANALEFISGSLGLRRGEIPLDPVLARIYICWCFFSGDVAQYTDDLENADGWFRQAAEACGEDNKGMRAFANYQQADVWIPSDTDRSMRVITQTGLKEAADSLEDLSLRAYLARMHGDIRWTSGDIHGAFDAYGRALLLAYVYQVDQESKTMPPSLYTRALYSEMRTRFLRRLGEAREKSQADAAVKRIRNLFGPYWELERNTTAAIDDPLAGIVPPLPDQEVLGTFDSGYVQDARLMLDDKLKDQIAEPVDQRLLDPDEQPLEGTAGRMDSPAAG
jgi:hypothetical protein